MRFFIAVFFVLTFFSSFSQEKIVSKKGIRKYIISDSLHYDKEHNKDAVGFGGQAGEYGAYAIFQQDSILNHAGKMICGMKMYLYDAPSALVYMKMQVSLDTMQEPIYEKYVAPKKGWNLFFTDSLIPLPQNKYLCIGYYVKFKSGYIGGVDAGPSIKDADIIYSPDLSGWTTLAKKGMNFNWNIRTMFVNLTNIEETQNKIINIYPNPAKDFVNIQIEGSASVRIYDSNLRVCISEKIENSKKISLQNIKKGLYIVVVERNGEISSSKLIVE